MNKQLSKKVKFLEDTKIKAQQVGVTCERCAIKNCKERQNSPIVLDRIAKNKKVESIVQELHSKFKS